MHKNKIREWWWISLIFSHKISPRSGSLLFCSMLPFLNKRTASSHVPQLISAIVTNLASLLITSGLIGKPEVRLQGGSKTHLCDCQSYNQKDYYVVMNYADYAGTLLLSQVNLFVFYHCYSLVEKKRNLWFATWDHLSFVGSEPFHLALIVIHTYACNSFAVLTKLFFTLLFNPFFLIGKPQLWKRNKKENMFILIFMAIWCKRNMPVKGMKTCPTCPHLLVSETGDIWRLLYWTFKRVECLYECESWCFCVRHKLGMSL